VVFSIEHRQLQHVSSYVASQAYQTWWLPLLPPPSWTGPASLVLLALRCCGGRAPACGWSADVRGPLSSMLYAMCRCTHMLRWLLYASVSGHKLH
jgi:hypothetical protein